MTHRRTSSARRLLPRRVAALLLVVILTFCSSCAPAVESSSSEDSSEPVSEYSSYESSEESSSEISEPEPEIENEVDIIPRHDEIAAQYEINPDTIGWLYIPDTEVNDAVVQRAGAEDNNYYLRRDNDGHYSWYGCFFADYESTFGSREELSRNNIIYAHNLGYNDNPDRPDFSQLFHYLDQDFAESHPYIFMSTAEEDMIWEVFAVFYTEATSWYIMVDISDSTQNQIIRSARERSQWIYNVNVDETDKLLTLSTCSYKYGGALNPQRFVVMARLVEKDKPLPASILVTANPEPREPEF